MLPLQGPGEKVSPDPNSEALFAVVVGQRSQGSSGGAVTARAETQRSPTPDMATGRFSKMHSKGLIPSTLNSWEFSPWLPQVSEEVSGDPHSLKSSNFSIPLLSEHLLVPGS